MMACAFGHREIVRLLLDAGADSRGTSKDGESAMKLAVEKKENDIVEMLQRNLATLTAGTATATSTPVATTAAATNVSSPATPSSTQ
jgi:ankyrin repeat protein